MKKFILILFVALYSIGYSATTSVTNMTGNGATLTNTGTAYVTISPNLAYAQCAFQCKVTKTSGTVAGYAVLQSSNDGTNYVDVDISDSLSFTDQTTNTKVFVITYNTQYYYRIKFVGRGTMAATIYGYCLTSGGSNKRSVSNMLSSYDLTSDTCTNSGTTYVGLTVSQAYTTVSIQALVTKISGTVGGTVTLQGSVDGTNYVTVSSSYSTAQTLSCSNTATQTKLFVMTGNPYKYYRLSYTGTGTMSAILKGYVTPNLVFQP